MPKRGAILDRNNRQLAVNLRVDSVYAVARDVVDKKATAEVLAPLLDKDVSLIYERVSRDKLFVWLARKISEKQAQKIEKLNLKGIHLIDETKRFYPNMSLASHIIGFSGTDNIGLEGVEKLYDRYMHGKKGYKSIIRDAKGREMRAFRGTYIPPVDGCSILLTIDEVIQHIAEKALAKACKKYRSKAGVVVVMDPFNGDILAMAVEPTYNLNNFSQVESDIRRNRAIADCYEPGSVFKIVTASACLDRKAVSIDDNFFCENGAWYVAGHTLHDYHGYGDLKFRDVIEKSSNIGTVKAAMILGEKPLYNYVKAYGLGRPTGISLPGEIGGILRPLNRWSRYSITAIPMGQELATTPLQLTSCVSVIANGGMLVKPRIIDRIIDSKGETIKEYRPVTVRRVISENTAEQMRDIMRGVVIRGTGKRARLRKYESAGKTGTSQKAEPGYGYKRGKFVASFAGFAPVKNPVIVITVMIDEPKPVHFGGTVSAPVFKDIAEATLSYLGTPPEEIRKE